MKLDTLVKDIYGVFDNAVEVPKEKTQAFAEGLAAMLASRLGERGETYLRLSNLGSACRRKLWYSINTPELAAPMHASTRIKFLFGDIIESLVLFLADVAGHKVTRQQEEVSVSGVPGHIDAFIDDELVDVKSASTYGFKKFKEHTLQEDDAFGYITQGDSYASATQSPRFSFLAVDKQHGYIALDTHEASGRDLTGTIDEVRAVIGGNTPPERGYTDEPDGKSGNRKLGVACSYCDFKDSCWPGLRTFRYARGPVFLTHVAREPRVPPE